MYLAFFFIWNGSHMDWKEHRVIVYGGGGFLGRYIIERLIALGVKDIVSFGRKEQPELEALGVTVIQGDIRERREVLDAAKGCSLVFHTAAKAGVWGCRIEYKDINVGGTQNVIDACLEHGIPYLVYTSSPSIAYDPSENIENIDETHPMPSSYLSFYSETKAKAEKLLLGSNCEALRVVALRPHLIWGPRDTHLIPRVIEKAKAGKLVQVGGRDTKVDLTYVENAAHAHILAMEALCNGLKGGEAYFISDDNPVNLWDWLDTLLVGVGLPTIKKSISYKQAYFVGKVSEYLYINLPFLNGEPPLTKFVAGQLAHSHYFNISKSKAELSYRPIVSNEEGLKRTIAWVKDGILRDENS